MADFANQSLRFSSEAVGENTLLLTRLSGKEQISGLFRFELELISTDAEIDLEAVLYQPAKVGIEHRGEFRSFRYFNGVLSEFEELEEGESWTTYRAVLVPDMWKLSEFYRSRVMQNVTLQTLVTEVLTRDLALADGTDFEFRLTRSGEAAAGDGTSVADAALTVIYPDHEYIVQYEETDFAFISRWLEHEGVFYFFENDGTQEKIVFADSRSAYKPVDVSSGIYPYRPQGHSQSAGSTSTNAEQAEEVLSFKCRLTRQPKTIALNDYNWRDPSNVLHTVQEVYSEGVGVQNEYNDHFKTLDQGAALATVRAEELTCRSKVYTGVTTCRTFRPGRTFELKEHFRADFNAEYLIIAVEHSAEQVINLRGATVTGSTYENAIEAIPAGVEFRPERETDWPSIKGVMHARIDGPADEPYAQLDAHGRYKVKFPFDQYAQHTDDDHAAAAGEASRWVRMAQPYAGVDSGMHFPLLKGTEVLITHIDGDPDRPVISGAVPNLETICPVDQGNAHQNRIQTTSGNTIVMDDDENLAGFVFIDASGRNIDDQRAPNQNFGGSTPGGGGGGSPRARSSEPLGPGLTKALQGGRPLPAGIQHGLINAGYGGAPDLGADAAVGEDGSNNLGTAGSISGLAALLHYHDDQKGWLEGAFGPLSDEGAPLDSDYTFKSKILTNQLSVDIGESSTAVKKAGSKFDYYDYPKITTVFTGFKKLLKHDGDTETKKETTGNRKQELEIQGDDESVSMRIGTTKSDSTHIGAAESKSTFLGTKKSESLTVSGTESQTIDVGAHDKTSITMSTENSLSITMSAKDTTSISMAAENSLSLTMSAKDTTTISMAAETSLSLTMAAKDSMSISLAAESSFALTLAAESKTDITLAAKDNLSVTIGLMNETSILVAGKMETKLAAGAFIETSLFAGVKVETKLSAAIIQENTLAAGTKIEVTLAGGGVNTITIPSENEVGLMNNRARLTEGFTSLMTNVTSALTKLGV